MITRDPAGLSSNALRSLVREGASTTARAAALNELVERSENVPTRFLSSIATDDDVETDVRLKAVGILGRTGTDTARDALTACLQSSSQPVIRRAALELAGVPGTAQLGPLKRVRTGNEVTQHALRWAKQLVSYRAGLGEYEVEQRPRMSPPDSEAAKDVAIGTLTRELTRELAKTGPAMGIELSVEQGVTLPCGSKEAVALINVEWGHGYDPKGAQGVPVVVLTRSPETGEFNASHFALTDPMSKEAVRVSVVRRTGELVMSGEGRVVGDSVDFELISTLSPYLAPTRVRGTVDLNGPRLEITQMISEKTFTPAQEAMVSSPTRQTEPA